MKGGGFLTICLEALESWAVLMKCKLTILAWFVVLIALTGCAEKPAQPVSDVLMIAQTATVIAPVSQFTPERETPLSVWLSATIPSEVRKNLPIPEGMMAAQDRETADLYVLPMTGDMAGDVIVAAVWTYVLAAPFPTLLDSVRIGAVESAWKGDWSPEFKNQTLLVSPETAEVFRVLWGPESERKVQVVAANTILEKAWQEEDYWALLPFEQLGPRWKVLRVGGYSPLDEGFVPQSYDLSVFFAWQGEQEVMSRWQEMSDADQPFLQNRDPSRITTVIMSGTTAMVRVLAFQMEQKGITYPGVQVRDWLLPADLVHVSNEVPMFAGCPPAVPLREEQRFCSAPEYLALLQYLGVDLIELTGNHILDWGQEAFKETLSLYAENDLPYYGGGLDVDDGREPYLFEHNGNRLAFVGCNAAGPENVWATRDLAGAAPCDMAWLAATVQQLRADGYLPIVTFQHYEMEDHLPVSKQRVDFQNIAREGAVIVSGSQAHYPQTMTFVGDTFVHYGLGNFLFDQMYEGNRRSFLDRHVFYDGKYLNTELLTIILEDGAQPRPMTRTEREVLLEVIFEKSVWSTMQ